MGTGMGRNEPEYSCGEICAAFIGFTWTHHQHVVSLLALGRSVARIYIICMMNMEQEDLA